MAPQVRNATVEQLLARIAERSHGVITRWEALAAGVTPQELKHRVRIGYLIRVHRGVYRLGHAAPSSLAAYMAATKACGGGCGLSGMAGAHLLELVTARPNEIEVVAARDRKVPGLVVHRSRVRIRLTKVRAIPVVTPAWALIDIAGRLDDEELGRACHQAHHRYRVKPEAVSRLLAERGGVKGLERREIPVMNRHATEGYIDCEWPGLDLIVELDSYRFHGSRRAWEKDRQRDRMARRRGKELIRYTWGDVYEEQTPCARKCVPDFPLSPVPPRHSELEGSLDP
jgi:hypothetical protein